MNKYDTQAEGRARTPQREPSMRSQFGTFPLVAQRHVGWTKGPLSLGVVNHYESGYQDYAGSGHPMCTTT